MADIDIDLSGLEGVKFGEEIREKEFCLRPGSCQINNGSYGNVPRRVLDVQKRYLYAMESHPDHWFRRVVHPEWNKARQAVADFVGADEQDLVFVTNATSGVNVVVQSLKLQPGEGVMGTSLTYSSIKQLWNDIGQRMHPQVQALLMEIKLPITSEDDIVRQYDDFLTNHPNVRLVLLDHITSPSALLMPVVRLAAVCKDHGVMVMVDGAHAPGQLTLDLRAFENVDFYTGNMHKWVYAPRGCAFLWVRREHHHLLHPPNTSVLRGRPLSEQFFNQGTRDHVPFLCAQQALKFYHTIGGMDKVVGYISQLASEAVDMLVKEGGLERMNVPPHMEAPNLRLLTLPATPASPCPSEEEKQKLAWDVQEHVYEDYDVQAIFDWVDGEFYLRISPQVHNTLEDFRRLLPVIQRFRSQGIPYRQ